MNGIILLDEESQRSLFDSQRSNNDSARALPPTHYTDGYRSDAHGPRREPRTDFTSRAEPPRSDFRTDFTTGGNAHFASPRRNFTTTASAGSGSPRRDFTSLNRPMLRNYDFPQKKEPRTDFTSSPRTDFTTGPRTDFTSGSRTPRTDFTNGARTPRTDFTNGPRTDFTTGGARGSDHSATGKPSNLTHRSSQAATATVDYPTIRDGLVTDDLRGDSYPILRDDPTRVSSTGSSSHHALDQYAGTSSSLTMSVKWLLVGVLLGLGLGVLFSQLKVSTLITQWVALPGDLFLRALRCLVVPYIFCAVAVAVGDIVYVGKASVIGVQTAKVFVLFWVCTVVMGVTMSMIFRPTFRVGHIITDSAPNAFGFTCPDSHLLSTMANGSISCSSNATTFTGPSKFVIKDKNSIFQTQSSDLVTLTLSDQTLMVLKAFVSDNIVTSLAGTGVLSTIMFAMLLGAFSGRSFFTKSRQTNYVYLTLLQLRNTFYLLIEWTIWLSPVAVVSIIAGSFATNQKYTKAFSDVYPLLLASLACALLQALVLYPVLVFLLTRCNPFSHMKLMLRAYLFAFASGSSLATMPVTLSCVRRARMCSQSVGNFVISFGVVAGLSSMGWYLPITLTFLAEASGNGDKLTAANTIGMAGLALLACAGTPSIPSASLVVVSTAYSTLIGPIPKMTFAMVITVDFLISRIATACNVNDDLMALKIIAETTDETVAQDHLGQRF
jgi:Na+/H+-dicarboxylate symporter